MTTTIDKIKEKYPLHWLVWNNDYQDLEECLKTGKYDGEKQDPRGRTPLMLAVRLCHLQSVKTLLNAKCNANAELDGWSIVQEAVCSGDTAILTAILEVRDLQRHIQRVTHVPQLLQKLMDAPDFYVEMKWEFTSWVPLMSRLCPSDVYKVYKRGSNVRIDTTLLGFDHTTWQRGDRSYIFKGQTNAATMIEIDHQALEVSVEQLTGLTGDINGIPPPRESVSARLNAPVSSNHIDMDKISFERNKSGIWGWRSEKCEDINGYNCKVFAASNVEFITRTRTEHLNESQSNMRNSRTPLQNLLGIAEDEINNGGDTEVNASANTLLLPPPPSPSPSPSPTIENGYNENRVNGTSAASVETPITPEEYFSTVNLSGRDVGRPPKINSKVQRFKANLWLSEEFPIKLQEQVLPILDLMSTMASPHVSKLKDFITMQLPSGFPVKIEIPLFHVLNACVTFGNVFGLETSIPNVQHIQEDDRLSCIIDDKCFDIPPHYKNKGADHRRQLTFEDEDDLLQYAIQQSLMEGGSDTEEINIWEALRAQRPITPNSLTDEETQLQRVLQESFYGYHKQLQSNDIPANLNHNNNINNNNNNNDNSPDSDPYLDMALKLSEEEQRRIQEELEEDRKMLEQVLRLSLEEK